MTNLKHKWKKAKIRTDNGTGPFMEIKKCEYCHCVRFSNNVCHRRSITYFGVPKCFNNKKRNGANR